MGWFNKKGSMGHTQTGVMEGEYSAQFLENGILLDMGKAARVIPYEQVVMRLKHMYTPLMIMPSFKDRFPEGDIIEVIGNQPGFVYMQAQNYVPDGSRLMPDCWGISGPADGDWFTYQVEVYYKKAGNTVLAFDRNGRYAQFSEDILLFSEIANLVDETWCRGQCKRMLDTSMPYIGYKDTKILTLGECILGYDTVNCSVICVGDTVVDEAGAVWKVAAPPRLDREGWMLWLENIMNSRWYTGNKIRRVITDSMLPVFYDADGHEMHEYGPA